MLSRQEARNKYYDLMNFAKNRKRRAGIYYERHHIIPKSLGGSNDSTNIVYLTAMQHYRSHKLLVRFSKGDDKWRMVCALKRFTNDTRRVYGVTASEYRKARILHAIAVSKLRTGCKQSYQTIKNMRKAQQKYFSTHPSHFYGKKHSSETKQKMSKSQSGKNNGFYGRHHDIETKNRISKKMAGTKKSEATRKRMSDAQYLRWSKS